MIAIVAATRDEISGFLKQVTINKEYSNNGASFFEVNLNSITLLIVFTGVGAGKARSAVRVMLNRYNPDILISAGFAGALSEDLDVGDIVVGTYSLSAIKEGKYKLANICQPSCKGVYSGTILTSNRFVNSPDKKAELASRYSALCVDMETWAVADEANKNSIPLMGIRVISDEYTSCLPDMGRIFNKKSKPDLKKALDYFFRNPRDLYKFIRFYFIDLQKAERGLSDSLQLLIPQINESTPEVGD